MATSSIPKSSGIYQITCAANGLVYIGSSNNLYKRWCEHRRDLRLGQHANQHLQNAWSKYGESAFSLEILELCMPWALINREQYWLDELKPYQRGVGFNVSEIADKPPSPKGRKVSQETRLKLSIANKGKQPSAEQRAKHSAFMKGRKPSQDAIAKTAAANRGRKRPLEAIEKSAAAHRGKRLSAEAVAKRTLKRSQKWIVTTPNGIEIEVKNLSLFCRENNLNQAHMWQVAAGNATHHKGWKCRHG